MPQQAVGGLVNDQPDVSTDAHRPEVPVPRLVELVKLHPRVGGVELEIERRRLDRLLLIAGQPCEAVVEGIGDAKLCHTSRRSRKRPK